MPYRKTASVLSRSLAKVLPAGVGLATGGAAYAAGMEPLDATIMGLIGGSTVTRGQIHKLRGGAHGQALREARYRVKRPDAATPSWTDNKYVYQDPDSNMRRTLRRPDTQAELDAVERSLAPLSSRAATRALGTDLALQKGGLGLLTYGAGTLRNIYEGSKGLAGTTAPTASVDGTVTRIDPLGDGGSYVFVTDPQNHIHRLQLPAGVSPPAVGARVVSGQRVGLGGGVGEVLTGTLGTARDAARKASDMAGNVAAAAKAVSEAASQPSDAVASAEAAVRRLGNDFTDQAISFGKNALIYAGIPLAAAGVLYWLLSKSDRGEERRRHAPSYSSSF